MRALPMFRYFGRGKIVATALALLEKTNRRRLRNIGSHFRKHAVAGQFSQFLNFDIPIAHSWAVTDYCAMEVTKQHPRL